MNPTDFINSKDSRRIFSPKCQKRGRGGRGVWGEFRRARAFRRSEAEAVSRDSFGKKFGFCSGGTATLYESERLGFNYFVRDFIQTVKKLNFPLGQYIVIGSGTLAALGIRLAQDVDISALSDLYEKLRCSGKWEEEKRYGKIFLKRDNVEINPELSWSDYSTTTREAIESAMVLDGVPFLNLEELRKFKQALGRNKDLKDIKLIDTYLAK